MKSKYLYVIIISLLTTACAHNLENPADTSIRPKKPSEALIGYWENSSNDNSKYYFNTNGKSVLISPIGDYFKGSYRIVAQDIDTRMLEVMIVDRVPGYQNSFHRRLKGNFTEDYLNYSGVFLSTVPKNMPFSFEYIDNTQYPPSRIIETALEKSNSKYRDWEKTALRLSSLLEEKKKESRDRAKEQKKTIKKQESEIGKLQKLITELKSSIKALGKEIPRQQ